VSVYVRQALAYPYLGKRLDAHNEAEDHEDVQDYVDHKGRNGEDSHDPVWLLVCVCVICMCMVVVVVVVAEGVVCNMSVHVCGGGGWGVLCETVEDHDAVLFVCVRLYVWLVGWLVGLSLYVYV
jgi:hypothetical protein